MKLISELKLKPGYLSGDIFAAVKNKYGINKSEIESFEIVKESIDSRKKPDIYYVINLCRDSVRLSWSRENALAKGKKTSRNFGKAAN